MRIRAFNRAGRLREVSTASDNLFLVGILVTPLFALGSSLDQVLVSGALLFILVGPLIIGLAFGYKKYWLRRIGARKPDDLNLGRVFAQITGVAERCQLPQIVIYWAPAILSVGARVFGVFRRTIAITGGLFVLGMRSPEQSEAIIAHEVAHLRNWDSRIYLFPALLTTTYLTNLFMGAFVEHPWAAIDLPVDLLLIAYFLKRREMIADSVALNLISDRGIYLAVLLSPRVTHGFPLTHPGRMTRCRALLHSSPVLKASPGFIVLMLFWMAATLVDPHNVLNIIFRFLFLVPALIRELSKGFDRKTPASLGETELALVARSWRQACSDRLSLEAASLRERGKPEEAMQLTSWNLEVSQFSIWASLSDSSKHNWRGIVKGAFVASLFVGGCWIAVLCATGPRAAHTYCKIPRPINIAVLENGSVLSENALSLEILQDRSTDPPPNENTRNIDRFNLKPHSSVISAHLKTQSQSEDEKIVFDVLRRDKYEALSLKYSALPGMFSNSGQLYADVLYPSVIRSFRTNPWKLLFQKQMEGEVSAMAFSGNEKRIIVAVRSKLDFAGSKVDILNLDGTSVGPSIKTDLFIEDLEPSQDATLFVAYTRDDEYGCNPEIQCGELLRLSADGRSWKEMPQRIPIVLSQSGRFLAEREPDTAKVQVLALPSMVRVVEIDAGEAWPDLMRFSPDDQVLAILLKDRSGDPSPARIQVWDTKGRELACMENETVHPSVPPAFSTDSHYLAVASEYGTHEGFPFPYDDVRVFDSNSWFGFRPWRNTACSWPWTRVQQFLLNLYGHS